jgi:hypothetical protein
MSLDEFRLATALVTRQQLEMESRHPPAGQGGE